MNAIKEWKNVELLPNDLLIAKKLVYDKCGFDCSKPIVEPESADYGACTFRINGLLIKYREAKITPTKAGQFVTIWKRNKNGPIEPIDIADDFNLIVISTRKKDYFGQFVFPIEVLFEKGIVSGKNKTGKRGTRVYPPWDVTTSQQANKTQQWQLPYFLEISTEHLADIILAGKLYATT